MKGDSIGLDLDKNLLKEEEILYFAIYEYSNQYGYSYELFQILCEHSDCLDYVIAGYKRDYNFLSSEKILKFGEEITEMNTEEIKPGKIYLWQHNNLVFIVKSHYTGDSESFELMFDQILQYNPSVVRKDCSDECPINLKKECLDNGFRLCGDFDTDPCLEWGKITLCKSDETCMNGACTTSTTQDVLSENEQNITETTNNQAVKEASPEEKTQTTNDKPNSSNKNLFLYSISIAIIILVLGGVFLIIRVLKTHKTHKKEVKRDICSKCKRKLTKKDIFCPDCGKKVQ